jgi:glucose-6-phosphate isomerase
MQLAKESDLRALIHAMFRGGKISITENGAVLQVALSAPKGASIVVDGDPARRFRCVMPAEAGIKQ